MKTTTYIPMLSLQIFAEGGAGAAAAGTGDGGTAQGQGVTAGAAIQQTKGAKSNPLANVRYGIQEDSAPAAEVQTETTPAPQADPSAEFEKLIKGQYKEQYNAKVQDTIQKRLKSSKETVDKFHALKPTLELLAQKYGIKDATDVEALSKAIADDDSYYEQEALEKGVSVQQLKEFRRIQRENAALRKQAQDQQNRENAERLYASWMNQADAIMHIYPAFDLQTELGNPRFMDLLRNNIDVRTAYEVLHRDEIIPAAMQFAAKTAESKLAKSMAANGARPSENGMSSQAAALVKSDVSQFTRADRDEIRRRVARGEKIKL